jgi:hypothetical protein
VFDWFHLLVPGGRWQTVMASPVSAARRASSTFQARTRHDFHGEWNYTVEPNRPNTTQIILSHALT